MIFLLYTGTSAFIIIYFQRRQKYSAVMYSYVRRPGQDEGYGLLESDYETIRLFSIGTIIKSLSSKSWPRLRFKFLPSYREFISPQTPLENIFMKYLYENILLKSIFPRHPWKIEQLQALQPILSDHSVWSLTQKWQSATRYVRQCKCKFMIYWSSFSFNRWELLDEQILTSIIDLESLEQTLSGKEVAKGNSWHRESVSWLGSSLRSLFIGSQASCCCVE